MRKNWIQTFSGEQFRPLSRRPGRILIVDIAHHLSNLCRFTGACDHFYSVAQHSLIVADIVRATDPANELHALLHDATEAYLNDLSKPVKAMLPDYCEAEDRLWGHVARKFGLSRNHPPSVKAADAIAIATERRDVCTHYLMHDWPGVRATPLPTRIIPMPPLQARTEFLRRYISLRHP